MADKTRARKKQAAPEPAKRSGPHSKYRPKIRSPKSVLLTQKGHELLDAQIRRTGYSISDFFEELLHLYGAKINDADPTSWDNHA